MGDPRSMLEGSSASMDDSCLWTEVSASNAQHAARIRDHLDFVQEYDRSMVSVGRKIGEGGQGCIYEAKFHLPYSFKPLPVVVKKFKTFEGVSQGHFPRELGSLKSCNLCLPLGVFFEGDSLCMIMERFSCDLRAAIDSRTKALRDEGFDTHCAPFAEEIGRLIVLQLATGLKFLHECGIYHGDLKAANVLLRTYGKNYGSSLPQLVNLAIADFERSDGVMGTAFFRAPEILRSLITDTPLSQEQWLLADVYSFGMVCYEVFTGMIPFRGHPLSNYDLVLNGGRPKIPDHVPEPMRDLILRCWHADPHSRPNWNEIINVLERHDDALVTSDFKSEINDLVSMESLSLASLIHESKQLVQDLTLLHESNPKSFTREFMPYYWASEFLVTAKEYASKFDTDTFPLTCSVQESFERLKLFFLLMHQVYGAKFGCLTFTNLFFEGHLEMDGHAHESLLQRERLQVMLVTIVQKVSQDLCKQEFSNEFEIGTSWTGKLLFFHALVKWVLWHEHAEEGMERQIIVICLVRNSVIQALLFLLCLILNTYIYILAMITCEPILLGLQYGLYKAKGSNNILYRSSGERICRFQRTWMNCTRYKVVSIILSFSFVSLFALYGWRGIFSWILFPCVLVHTPCWRRPILVGRVNR